jgi:serine protease Do
MALAPVGGEPLNRIGPMTRRFLPLLATLIFVACAPDAEPGDAAPGQRAAVAPEEGFRGVVHETLPAIVFIQAEVAAAPGFEGLLPQGHPLQDEPVMVGIGSGVLYTDDGYILTNNHVVQDAERVMVVLHDRRLLEARVVGRDPATEVAVVKVDGRGFPTAHLGDSDAIALGDWALAMGSPLGLQFSVTAGIISGIGRDIGILRRQPQANAGQTAPLEHFIQTDAALSPGNSGGPLLNTAGEVIGINTAVAAAPGAGGYGFAIPVNLARHVADQLVQHGEVRRAYLGVILRNVTPAVAREAGLDRVAGALVEQMEEGGPAARAGVRPGDVVVGIGDDLVATVNDLQARLARIEPGITTELHLLRDGRELSVSVELGGVRSGVAAR